MRPCGLTAAKVSFNQCQTVTGHRGGTPLDYFDASEGLRGRFELAFYISK